MSDCRSGDIWEGSAVQGELGYDDKQPGSFIGDVHFQWLGC
jgi:hypothetical protein